MLETHQHLQAMTGDAQRDVMQQQIDALVYSLYGLSEAEVAVVKGDSGAKLTIDGIRVESNLVRRKN